MCGIAGFCDFKRNLLNEKIYNTTLLKKMHDTLAHRGKDSFGTILTSSAGLSHARLSIRDINGGLQPMKKTKNHNDYYICYNGEIYNTDELKSDLISKGYIFDTTSDTEIIINCFLEYGPDFVNKLNGIFAFAIWDNYNNRLYLYRDRVGVKPLFYYSKNELTIFASEPKAIFCHPSITPEIDLTSLQEIIGIGPARTSGCGIFKNIHEIIPGHYLIITKYGICDQTYWELESHEHEDNYNQTLEKVRFLVIDSIKRQLVSDVPICTFLSGGLDSSIVTAIAANELKKTGQIINTFSFDFEENNKYFISNSFQPEQDRPYVDIMLQKYNTNHNYLECNNQTLFKGLFESVDAKDFPGMTDVESSLLYFCKLVAKQNKVALTGECADEIFGGYPWFYRPNLLYAKGFPWSSDIAPRCVFLSDEYIVKLDLESYSYDKYVTSLNKTPLLETENLEQKRRRQVSYLNIKWFMQTLLDRMDRTSMYSGLEARVPYADHRIIEYLFNVPWEMKYQNGVEKALLREATKDLLPKELFTRKKSPYPKTYNPKYETLLKQKFSSILDDNTSPIIPLINKDKAYQFIASPKDYGKPWFGQLMAGPALMAYFIQIDYWMRKYKLELP